MAMTPEVPLSNYPFDSYTVEVATQVGMLTQWAFQPAWRLMFMSCPTRLCMPCAVVSRCGVNVFRHLSRCAGLGFVATVGWQRCFL